MTSPTSITSAGSTAPEASDSSPPPAFGDAERGAERDEHGDGDDEELARLHPVSSLHAPAAWLSTTAEGMNRFTPSSS